MLHEMLSIYFIVTQKGINWNKTKLLDEHTPCLTLSHLFFRFKKILWNLSLKKNYGVQ